MYHSLTTQPFNDGVDNPFEELHKNSLAVITAIFQRMLVFIKTTYCFKGGETCTLHSDKVFENLECEIYRRLYQNHQNQKLSQSTVVQCCTVIPKPVLKELTYKQGVPCPCAISPCLRYHPKKQRIAVNVSLNAILA